MLTVYSTCMLQLCGTIMWRRMAAFPMNNTGMSLKVKTGFGKPSQDDCDVCLYNHHSSDSSVDHNAETSNVSNLYQS